MPTESSRQLRADLAAIEAREDAEDLADLEAFVAETGAQGATPFRNLLAADQ